MGHPVSSNGGLKLGSCHPRTDAGQRRSSFVLFIALRFETVCLSCKCYAFREVVSHDRICYNQILGREACLLNNFAIGINNA